MRHWLRATRPLALLNLVPPIGLGIAAAHGFAVEAGRDLVPDGGSLGAWLGFCAAFAVIDLCVIVWSNEVADHEADRLGRRTPISGGSGVIADELVSARALVRATVAAVIALLILAGSVAGERPWMPAFAVAALGLLWVYSGRPRVSYRSGGALLQALGVGVVLPTMGAYAVSGSLDGLTPLLIAGAVVLGLASHLLTAIPDERGDSLAGKRTVVVRLGEFRARLLATGLIVGGGLLSPWIALGHVWGGLGIAAGGSALVAASLVRDPVRFAIASLGSANLLLLTWIAGVW